MGIFDSLGKSSQQQAAQQPRMDQRQMQKAMHDEISRISAHPIEYLKEKGYKVPDGMTDASQITNYLLQSGQIGGARYQQVMRFINGMPRR